MNQDITQYIFKICHHVIFWSQFKIYNLYFIMFYLNNFWNIISISFKYVTVIYFDMFPVCTECRSYSQFVIDPFHNFALLWGSSVKKTDLNRLRLSEVSEGSPDNRREDRTYRFLSPQLRLGGYATLTRVVWSFGWTHGLKTFLRDHWGWVDSCG